MNKFFNLLYKCLMITLCILGFKSYGNNFHENNIDYILVKKYGDDVHISGTYDCNEFDNFYGLFSLAGVGGYSQFEN